MIISYKYNNSVYVNINLYTPIYSRQIPPYIKQLRLYPTIVNLFRCSTIPIFSEM